MPILPFQKKFQKKKKTGKASFRFLSFGITSVPLVTISTQPHTAQYIGKPHSQPTESLKYKNMRNLRKILL